MSLRNLLKSSTILAFALVLGGVTASAASAQEVVQVQVEEVPNLIPAPAEADLETPALEMLEIPALPEDDSVDDNLFYDADALLPSGEMGVKGGPRKVNPRLEPGSKYIVVKKNYGAGSHKAKLVSAERAMTLGRFDSALMMYDELYARNKRDPNVLLGRATALQKLGQTEAAIQAYEAVLDLKPKNVEAQINMIGLLGQRYPAVALRRLEDLRDGNPNHVGVAAQIAVVQAELGHYDEAIKYLGLAAGMEPHNANHVFNMAVIADRTGNKKEAVKYYEQALEIDTVYGGGRTISRDVVFERLARLR